MADLLSSAKSVVHVPYLDRMVSAGEGLNDEIKDLVRGLRGEWKANDIRLEEFSDGYNNKLVACMREDDARDKNDVIVVRIYGRNTELMVNRDVEIACQALVHSAGPAPQLICRFRNGFVYRYSRGSVLDLDLAYDVDVMRLLTQELATIHSIKPESIQCTDNGGSHLDVKPKLFQGLDNFLRIIPEAFDDPEKQTRLKAMTGSREELQAEVDYLRRVLPPLGSPVVLCHNDLLFNNILYDADNKRVTFIDFEYAGFNYQAFEIATHFCEYAGMKDVDYSHYPDRSYQFAWCRYYLEAQFQLEGRDPDDVTEPDVERMFVQIDWYTLAAHLFWGLWALVQSKYSEIDYDYLKYSSIRISEYFRKKNELTADKDDASCET